MRIHSSLRFACGYIADMIPSAYNKWSYYRVTTCEELARNQQEILVCFMREVLWDIVTRRFPPDSIIHTDLKDIAKSLLTHYIKSLLVRVPCDPQCYVVALIYLETFLSRTKILLDLESYKTYFALSLVLSTKMWEDRYAMNICYYNCLHSGILKKVSFSEFNRIERMILKGLNYELYIPVDVFRRFIVSYSKALAYEIQCALRAVFTRDRILTYKRRTQL